MPTPMVIDDTLTTYAQLIAPDWMKILKEAHGVAPIVETGALAGKYMKFDSKQCFIVPDTRRAVGGATQTAQWNGELVPFVLDPNALKIPVDLEIEVPLAGKTSDKIREVKTRTLLCQSANSFAAGTFRIVRDATKAAAGKGKWDSATVDPLAEIEEGIEAVEDGTGLTPNVVTLSKPMWRKIKKHPKVVARFPGKSNAITPQLIAEEIGDGDLTLEVVGGRGFEQAGLGGASVRTAPFLGNTCIIHYRDVMPSQYSPGFAATLSYDSAMLDGVYTYVNDEGTVEFIRVKWAFDVVIQSSLLAYRIDFAAGK